MTDWSVQWRDLHLIHKVQLGKNKKWLIVRERTEQTHTAKAAKYYKLCWNWVKGFFHKISTSPVILKSQVCKIDALSLTLRGRWCFSWTLIKSAFHFYIYIFLMSVSFNLQYIAPKIVHSFYTFIQYVLTTTCVIFISYFVFYHCLF